MVINATTDEAVTAGDSAVSELYCSGMYISSISYTIPTDGTCTEDVSFVGNNKKWIINPAAGDAYYYRGIVFEELGNKENAEADYAKAKELGHEPE